MSDALLAIVKGQLSLPATNIVKNGDFSNGTTGWIIEKTNVTLLEKGAKLVATESSVYDVRLSQDINIINGHKYYYRIVCKKISGTVSKMILASLKDSMEETRINLITGTEIIFTTIFSGLKTISDRIRLIRFFNNVSTDDEVEVYGVTLIDITDVFGAGNEPTKGEINDLLKHFPDSYFNGTRNLSQALSILTLNKLRDLEALVTTIGGGGSGA